MSKNIKTRLIITLTAIFAVFISIGVMLSFSSVKRSAYAISERYFYTLAGAEVKMTGAEEYYGMRFRIYLSGSVYNDIIADGEFKENKSLGAIIVPYSYVEDYETYMTENPTYTGGYYGYFKDIKGKMIHFNDVKVSDINFDSKLGLYRLNIVLSNIYYANINREYVAIGYIKSGTDYEYTEITAAHKRSVSYVASVVVANNKDQGGVCANYVKKGELQKLGVAEADIESSGSQFDFIYNGATEYKLVYPNGNTSANMNFARTEFKLWFKKATGIDITEVSDSGLSYSADAKYISLGDTAIKSGASVSATLTETGYAVKRQGNSVFLFGGSDYGTINAVYEFLRRQFNYECYTEEIINIDVGVMYAKLIDEDYSGNPDITWRVLGSGPVREVSEDRAKTTAHETFARRLETNLWTDYLITMDQICHNFTETVNLTTYPQYKATVGGEQVSNQLCLSGGDTTDYVDNNLVDLVVSKMKTAISADTDSYCLGFSPMDDATWCECTACTAAKTRYGSNSGVYILFMNACARQIKTWNNDAKLYMLAYQDTIAPPTNNLSELTLESNLYVQYCPIYAAGYHSYDNALNGSDSSWSELNSNRYEDDRFDIRNYATDIPAWYNLYSSADRAAGKKLMFWHYSFYYVGKGYPYYDFNDINDTYSYLKTYCDFVFDQDHDEQNTDIDWLNLKLYVRSKLGWDTTANIDTYTDKFMNAYFGVAAPHVKKAYNAYSEHYENIIKNHNIRGQGGVHSEILYREYWSEATLNTILGYFEDAYAAIDYLKISDSALYETLADRILRETVSIRMIYDRLYGENKTFDATGNTLADDILDLALDLPQPIRVENLDSRITIEPVSDSGYLDLYGGNTQAGTTVKKWDSSIFGRSDVYVVNFRWQSYDYKENTKVFNPLYLRGATAAELSENGYNYLYFDLYLNSNDYSDLPNIYVRINDTSYNLNALSSNDYVKLYNSDGESIDTLAYNEWLQVRVDISSATALAKPYSTYADVLKVRIISQQSNSVYFSNAVLYSVPTENENTSAPVAVDSSTGGDGFAVTKSGNEYTFTNIVADGTTVNRFRIHKDYLRWYYANNGAGFMSLKVESVSGQLADFTVNTRLASAGGSVLTTASGTDTVYVPAYNISSYMAAEYDYYVDVIVTDVSGCDSFKVTVSLGDTMYIHDVNELQTFASLNYTEYSTGKYKLANNINLGDNTVGAVFDNTGNRYYNGFYGTFDGNGYTIKGGEYSQAGLFGNMLPGSVVKNLTLENAVWNGTQNDGALFAWLVKGTVQNVNINASYSSSKAARTRTFTIYEINGGMFTDVNINVDNNKAGTTIYPVCYWQRVDGTFTNVQVITVSGVLNAGFALAPAAGNALTSDVKTYCVYPVSGNNTFSRTTFDGKAAYKVQRSGLTNSAYADRINIFDNDTNLGNVTTKDMLSGKVLAFDFYYTGTVGAVFATKNNATTFDLTAANYSAENGYVSIYDADGNAVRKITANAWYTLKWNGDELFGLESGNKPIYFRLGDVGTGANISDFDYENSACYFADFRVLDETFVNGITTSYSISNDAGYAFDMSLNSYAYFAAVNEDGFSAYKMTIESSYGPWANKANILGGAGVATAKSYMDGKYLVMNFKYTESAGAVFRPDNNYIYFDLTQEVYGSITRNNHTVNIQDYVLVYDNTGNQLTSGGITANKWYTLVFDGTKMFSGNGNAYMYYAMGDDAIAHNRNGSLISGFDMANSATYFANVRVVDEEGLDSLIKWTPFDANGKVSTITEGIPGGKEGSAVKLTRSAGASAWTTRFTLFYTGKDRLVDNYLVFDFYYTASSGAVFRPNNNYVSFDVTSSINSSYVKIYNAAGNPVDKITANAWYTFIFDGNMLYGDRASGTVGNMYFNFGDSGNGGNISSFDFANNAAYFMNMRIVSEISLDSAINPGNATYAANITIETVTGDDAHGKTSAVKVVRTGASGDWNERVNIVPIAGMAANRKLFLDGQYYVFDFYYTGANTAQFLPGGDNKWIGVMSGTNFGTYLKVYNSSGTQVSSITANEWYTFVWDGTVLYTNALDMCYYGLANAETYFANFRMMNYNPYN